MRSLVLAYCQLVRFVVCLAIAATFVSLAAVAWLVVIAVGLLHPHLSPRRSCDWFREFLRQSGAQVKALDPR